MMPDAAPSPPPLPLTLAIVGVGLLGGSVALAAKRRGFVRRVIGIGRSRPRLEAARQSGLLDEVATSLAAAAEADLVVVCTPVDRLARDVLDAAEIIAPHATVTDVGSIKAAIVGEVAVAPLAHKYVPAHPLAGSEQAGWEAASAQLFEQRLCVLTPFEGCDPARCDRVEEFWRALGLRTTRVAPAEHDRLLALTSHLPHVAAAAVAQLVGAAERPFAATGFRDTTRIAGGDPAIWTPILLGNASPVQQAIRNLQEELETLRQSIEAQDADGVTRWLEAARRQRAELLG